MTILYVDLFSQPSRAVLLFCRINHLDVEVRELALSKGEHRSPTLLQLNPLGKVPFIQEGHQVLVESAAILRWLTTTRSTPDHWYPQEPQARAAVDAALDWYHGNLRAAARLVWWRVLHPQGPHADILGQEALTNVQNALKMMEAYWLKDRPFVAGSAISIADLLWCCELEQLTVLEASTQDRKLEGLLKPHSAVQAWRQRVVDSLGPDYADVNQKLSKVTSRLAARKKPETLQTAASKL